MAHSVPLVDAKAEIFRGHLELPHSRKNIPSLDFIETLVNILTSKFSSV